MTRNLFRIALSLVLCLGLAAAGAAQSIGGSGNDSPSNGGEDGYGEDGNGARGGPREIPRNLVMVRGRVPEYIVLGPPSQAAAAAAALTGAGAQLRRTRDYPNLGRRAQFFEFPEGLSVAAAQTLLDQAAPQSVADFHVYYRFAQAGPRVYAGEMVGLAAPGGCRVPGNVTLGLIDGPVDPSHPALAGVEVTNESVLGDGARVPGAEHGTAVAALMVGQDPTGVLAGFASGARLHAVLAFGRGRGGEVGDVEAIGAALDRLTGRGVRLINMSFAGPENRALGNLLSRAASRGVVMVAAAGNGGTSQTAYPAGAPEVIAVTAIDAGYRRYRQANTGGYIEFAAPGVDVFVAGRRGGSYASGTSYAAPIVTALVARIARGASVQTVRNRLRASAVDLGQPGRDGEFGWGLVRVGGC